MNCGDLLGSEGLQRVGLAEQLHERSAGPSSDGASGTRLSAATWAELQIPAATARLEAVAAQPGAQDHSDKPTTPSSRCGAAP